MFAKNTRKTRQNKIQSPNRLQLEEQSNGVSFKLQQVKSSTPGKAMRNLATLPFCYLINISRKFLDTWMCIIRIKVTWPPRSSMSSYWLKHSDILTLSLNRALNRLLKLKARKIGQKWPSILRSFITKLWIRRKWRNWWKKSISKNKKVSPINEV